MYIRLLPILPSRVGRAALLAVVVAHSAGCFKSPEAKKQKFYEQGVGDFDKQRYAEAVISFSRALQIDPRFADAHYKLAQCQERRGNWGAAIQELNRVI